MNHSHRPGRAGAPARPGGRPGATGPLPREVRPERAVAGRPADRHALYRAVMSSHDRVTTRHLDRR